MEIAVEAVVLKHIEYELESCEDDLRYIEGIDAQEDIETANKVRRKLRNVARLVSKMLSKETVKDEGLDGE